MPGGINRRDAVLLGHFPDLPPEKWLRLYWPHGFIQFACDRHGFAYEDVAWALNEVPDHYKHCFGSPGGWSTLAFCVSIELGQPHLPHIAPTIQ